MKSYMPISGCWLAVTKMLLHEKQISCLSRNKDNHVYYYVVFSFYFIFESYVLFLKTPHPNLIHTRLHDQYM